MPSIAHAAYFYFSLFFLLGRTLAVSLYSSTVHDESRKPLRILRCVPKESWCLEVRRFEEEISNDLVALSGMKFFHLTRKLVLSVSSFFLFFYSFVLVRYSKCCSQICTTIKIMFVVRFSLHLRLDWIEFITKIFTHIFI